MKADILEELKVLEFDKSSYLTSLVDWAMANVQDLKCDRSLRTSTLDQNLGYILECLGPTLMDLKPAELLNIGIDQRMAWDEFKYLLTRHPEVGLEEVRRVNKRRQVLFYNRRILSRQLSNPVIQEFLQGMNYPKSYSLEAHIQHLVQKIRFEDFPHEVGIFLGYPLKDVLGFMGLVSLPYVKTQGWRIYGDQKLSDEWFERYQQARRLMNKALSQ